MLTQGYIEGMCSRADTLYVNLQWHVKLHEMDTSEEPHLQTAKQALQRAWTTRFEADVANALRQEKLLKKRKGLRNFKSVSELDKQVLLLMSGFGWDPEREPPLDSVSQKQPECFESQQIKVWKGVGSLVPGA